MKIVRDNFFNNISLLDTKDKIFVHETDSRRGLLSLGRSMFGKFDYIYLDGSHTQQDTLFDLTLALCLIKTNGVVIVDDYNNTMATNNTLLRPKKAVDFVVETMNNDVQFYTTKERQAVIIKR
jgi:predicted O-methyltransferase YrrM